MPLATRGLQTKKQASWKSLPPALISKRATKAAGFSAQNSLRSTVSATPGFLSLRHNLPGAALSSNLKFRSYLSGSKGYTGGGLSGGAGSQGLAVDGSGNVWVANGSTNSVSELIGVAAPVVTPIVAGVKNNTLGTRP